MPMPFVVLKFGGTDTAPHTTWRTVAHRIRRHQDRDRIPIVVCDALLGVPEALAELVALAIQGRDVVVPLARIKERHVGMAAELGVDPAIVAGDLATLERLARGMCLVGEASPRVRAQIFATGASMASRLGSAWLEAAEIEVTWIDARSRLEAVGPASAASDDPQVPHAADSDLIRDLGGHRAVVTQGGVASVPAEGAAWHGGGGADRAAMVLAGRLQAMAVEIWTDVPGMFTADPHKHPAARLVKALDYAEAQEMATSGTPVVHPAALSLARIHGIEVSIRCVGRPSLTGTRIGANTAVAPAQVKALSIKKGLVLISLETVGMWREVGFLARAFAAFAHHGLSVDAVSTSETNVTVTLDPASNDLDSGGLDAVVHDLESLCQPTVIPGCAGVSLVGRGIRSILHQLAPALELFEEHRVHLMTQAANDLNLTFVVDDETADRLADKLHAMLFAHRGVDPVLGPTWRELIAGEGAPQAPVRRPWWHDRQEALRNAAAASTPVYVYDEVTLTQRARALSDLSSVDRVLYAVKANPHPEILRRMASVGLGFECVSPGEIARVRQAVGHGPTVLFTPNFAAPNEYRDALRDGVRVTLDNLHPLEHWPALFSDREVFVRLDPGSGRGHHAKVRTAGTRSKFGIPFDQLDRLGALVEAAGCKVVGLHAHTGSGVLDPGAWPEVAASLAAAAERFPEVRVFDLGGGLGVPDRPGRAGLDLAALDAALAKVRQAHPDVALWLEPGRFLVAEGGVLLARVTQLKEKGDLRYIGVDAGMHTLLRPALYGAHHHVANLTRLEDPITQVATVVGPICETGDVLARDRRLPMVAEGDVLLFATAGAYGAAMANDYTLRGRPAEVFLTRSS